MNATKRLKIRLEKHELKVIRFGRRRKFFCESCQAETQHLTVSQMSTVLDISEINVFRLAETGQVDWLETDDGKLMICVESIKTNI
jgi:hypothetical protein